MTPVALGAPEIAIDAGAQLGEGPVWDDERREVVWVDVDLGLVHRYSPERGLDAAREVGQDVAAACPRTRGGLVLAVRDGFALLDAESGAVTLAVPLERDRPRNRMNDGACDTHGRFWAGTMSTDRELGCGTLYRLDADLTATPMLEGVSISNGVGWSPDERLMYYVDTPTGRVDVLDFDSDAGAVRGRRPLVAIPPRDGRPDGLTVDADGCIWVALWGGGAVQRYTPDGRLDRRLELPVSQVTSCCFGGEDRSTLYVTSAARGVAESEPHAGALFAWPAPASGLPTTRFAG